MLVSHSVHACNAAVSLAWVIAAQDVGKGPSKVLLVSPQSPSCNIQEPYTISNRGRSGAAMQLAFQICRHNALLMLCANF